MNLNSNNTANNLINWYWSKHNDIPNLAGDRLRFDVLNHTDLSREKGDSHGIDLKNINWGNYDLIVIDESHNFRNLGTHKDKETLIAKVAKKLKQKIIIQELFTMQWKII
jgi:SNF2 family DNA or RNA helicase